MTFEAAESIICEVTGNICKLDNTISVIKESFMQNSMANGIAILFQAVLSQMDDKSTGIAYALGFIFGVLIVSAIVVVIILIATKEDGSIKCKYDERQELIRGRAYKISFYIMLICNFIYVMLDEVYDKLPIETSLYMALVVILCVGTHAWYCIYNGAYIALNENTNRIIVALSLVGLFNIVLGITSLVKGEWVEDGMLTFNCSNMACGCMLLITVLVIIAKRIHDKKEED